MKRRKMKWKRYTACALAAAILSCMTAASGIAGPPQVDTDEALYVNLDYYGKPTQSSVVKGCNLNGNREFTDYGNYLGVTNMSNYAQPQILQEGVTWQLPKDSKERFYYECQMEADSVVLPWDFDISYRLNGLPVEAEKLVNADGLVEIDVICTPNDRAKDYYKNNMILQVASMVNMEDVNNIEAPGSQLQSLGTYKIIVFAALPGEEETFHMEISTTKFESMGVFMMMIPGTLDQMSEIRDIREVKDQFYESTDELVDSLNELLQKLDRLTFGMDVAREGLEELQRAREKLDARKDDIRSKLNLSLDSLEELSGLLGNSSSDINVSKDALEEINGKMNSMVDTMRDSTEDFSVLSGKLYDLKSSLEDMKSALDASEDGDIGGTLEEVQSQLDDIESLLTDMSDTMEGLGDPSEMSKEELEAVIAGLNGQAGELLGQLSGLVGEKKLEALKKQLSELSGEEISVSYNSLLGTLKKYKELVDKCNSIIENLKSSIKGYTDDALRTGKGMAKQLGDICNDIENLIGNVDDLNIAVNDNKGSLDQTLDNAAAITDQLTVATATVADTLRSVQDTLDSTRSDLEDGTEDTLNGLIDILEEAAEGGTVGRVQEANENLRDSVKGEIDKIDEDTNVLNLDTKQPLISFTSDKNPEPSSIQIILRSQEITEDTVNTDTVDLEPAYEQPGLWQKIVSVFKKIWDTITGWFS